MKLKTADERILIGIDCGGTKTEFVLFASSGRIFKIITMPGANSSTIGVDAALEIHIKGIEQCLAVRSDVAGIFLGTAGGNRDVLEQRLSEHYPSIPIKVESDGVNALKSAEGDAALICGTGSILLREAEDGSYQSIGGWGYLYGDPGSAYNFGREAIRAAFAYEDGIGGSKRIYEYLLEKTGVGQVRGSFSRYTVAEIAQQAAVINRAYQEGDPAAVQIVHNEMRELANMIQGSCKEGDRLILCGGVMAHFGDRILPVLKQYITENIQFIKPKLPPVYGACISSMERFYGKAGNGFTGNFEKDYRRLKGES